jgi:hypothetical protein
MNFQIEKVGGWPQAGPVVVINDQADFVTRPETPGNRPKLNYDPVFLTGFQWRWLAVAVTVGQVKCAPADQGRTALGSSIAKPGEKLGSGLAG